MTDPRDNEQLEETLEGNITEQWDREDGDSAWCLPTDLGDQ